MITLRKLDSLGPGTRSRKCLRLLEGFEKELLQGSMPDLVYLRGVLTRIETDIDTGVTKEVALTSSGALDRLEEDLRQLRAMVTALLRWLDGGGPRPVEADELLRELNGLRHTFGRVLTVEPGDWDLHPPRRSGAVEGPVAPMPLLLALEEIRSPFNLGSIARSAEAFGAAGLLLSPGVPSANHPRARRAAMGAFAELPLERRDWTGMLRDHQDHEAEPGSGESPSRDEAGATLPIFALESGGVPIGEFAFPERGVCLIGSEELGLSPAALERADRSWGRCSIPLYGGKGSLNVGVAVGVLLHRWTETLMRRAPGDDGEATEKKGSPDNRRNLFDTLISQAFPSQASPATD